MAFKFISITNVLNTEVIKLLDIDSYRLENNQLIINNTKRIVFKDKTQFDYYDDLFYNVFKSTFIQLGTNNYRVSKISGWSEYNNKIYFKFKNSSFQVTFQNEESLITCIHNLQILFSVCI